MQRTTEQHHALGSAASYHSRDRAGAGVRAKDACMADPRLAPTGIAATFGTWNDPRRLVGSVP